MMISITYIYCTVQLITSDAIWATNWFDEMIHGNMGTVRGTGR